MGVQIWVLELEEPQEASQWTGAGVRVMDGSMERMRFQAQTILEDRVFCKFLMEKIS